MPRYIYLDTWQQYRHPDGDAYYASPYRESRLGQLDFRSEADLIAGNFLGPMLVVYAEEHSDLDLFVANDVNDTLTDAKVADIESYVGVPTGSITSRVLKDILWELFTSLADATGQLRWRPIAPNAGLQLNLHLGGFSPIRSESFQYGAHPHTSKLREMYRDAYTRHYDRIQQLPSGDKTRAETSLRKWLGALGEKYSVDGREFLSGNRPDLPPLSPTTLIQDDFADNLNDWDTAGADGTWSVDTGRMSCDALSGNGRGSILHGTAQSDADMYVQGALAGPTEGGTTGKNMLVMPRCQDVNNGVYGGVEDSFTPTLVLGTVSADSLSEVASVGSFGWTAWWGLKVICSGTDVSLEVDQGSGFSEEIAAQTITDFQTELEIGVWSDRTWGQCVDDFESDDLGAAGDGAEIMHARGRFAYARP